MKRKQIIVLGLVLVIIAVGILQYNSGGTGEYQKSTEANIADTVDVSIQPEDIPGAAVYVNGEEPAKDVTTAADSNQSASSGYFAEARLDRDKARSKQKEELKSLAENGDPVNPATLQAQEDLVSVINRCEIETTIESLIKQRGFADVMVYMSDTGNIDVIVNASSLSAQQVAQISDIVIRHADVTMENITVRNDN